LFCLSKAGQFAPAFDIIRGLTVSVWAETTPDYYELRAETTTSFPYLSFKVFFYEQFKLVPDPYPLFPEFYCPAVPEVFLASNRYFLQCIPIFICFFHPVMQWDGACLNIFLCLMFFSHSFGKKKVVETNKAVRFKMGGLRLASEPLFKSFGGTNS